MYCTFASCFVFHNLPLSFILLHFIVARTFDIVPLNIFYLLTYSPVPTVVETQSRTIQTKRIGRLQGMAAGRSESVDAVIPMMRPVICVRR